MMIIMIIIMSILTIKMKNKIMIIVVKIVPL